MELRFTVSGRIAKPVHEVFEAVVDPRRLSGYFTTGGAQGRLESGATVTWDFHDFPGAFPVEVVKVDEDREIVLRWEADDDGGYDTEVRMTFTALDDGGTMVSISESGWRNTDSGLRASYGNCGGWMQMLACMKAYLEYGINLRAGFFNAKPVPKAIG
jgi:uncharacterized protein YndB with AHSA1/START domain